MPTQVTRTAPAAPVEVEIAGLSPHVLAYRMWFRTAAGAAWALLGEGHTGDERPDRLALDLPADRPGQLYYWVGVGDPRRPRSTWAARLTLAQGGQPLAGGVLRLGGLTDDAGVAVEEDWCDIL
jgi:hypothetical protein